MWHSSSLWADRSSHMSKWSPVHEFCTYGPRPHNLCRKTNSEGLRAVKSSFSPQFYALNLLWAKAALWPLFASTACLNFIRKDQSDPLAAACASAHCVAMGHRSLPRSNQRESWYCPKLNLGFQTGCSKSSVHICGSRQVSLATTSNYSCDQSAPRAEAPLAMQVCSHFTPIAVGTGPFCVPHKAQAQVPALLPALHCRKTYRSSVY